MKKQLSKTRIQEIQAQIANKRILIIGDVGVDRYTIGKATRISDEAPVPIVTVRETKNKLGLAANVADNVVTFGASAHLCSLIGECINTSTLKNLLEHAKIDTKLLFSHSTRVTTLKERVVANNQQVVRIDHEEKNPISDAAEEFFWSNTAHHIKNFDAIILEDYGKGLISVSLAQKIIAEANQNNIPVFVDPPSTGGTIAMYQNAYMITPNLRETERIARLPVNTDKEINAAGNFLLENLKVKVAAITRGKKGISLFTKDSAPVHIASRARSVFDVSGAGDTVISILALANLTNASLREAAELANYAAAVEVGKWGTATVTFAEIYEFIGS